MASVEANQMLAVAAAACDDKKAEDIRILALDPAESGLSDYFLICTGTNDRQTVAITDEIELRLKREFGAYPNAVEGRRQGEWILMDYVDFIVHVFLPEKRAFYGLERLRTSATTLSVADLNAEIKQAIKAERSAKKGSRATGATQDGPATGEPEEGGKEADGRAEPAKGGAKAGAKRATGRKTAAPARAIGGGTKASARSSTKTAGKRTSAKVPGTRAAARTAAGGGPAKSIAKAASSKLTGTKAAAKKTATTKAAGAKAAGTGAAAKKAAAKKTAAKKGARREG